LINIFVILNTSRYSLSSQLNVHDNFEKVRDMPHVTKIAVVAAFFAMLGGISNEASARGRLYPLTRCGPNLAYLCPLHGYFDQVPFHYNLAIYPGCIKFAQIETPHGIERRPVLVCG
jgi:hypothetical protein